METVKKVVYVIFCVSFIITLILVIAATALGIGMIIYSKRDDQSPKSGEKVEYKVCDRDSVPDRLDEIITARNADIIYESNSKKSKDLNNTNNNSEYTMIYENNTYMYLVACYGLQERGNLSIVVGDIFKYGDRIYLKTKLVTGNTENEKQLSTPYIVVRIKKEDVSVIFEMK